MNFHSATVFWRHVKTLSVVFWKIWIYRKKVHAKNHNSVYFFLSQSWYTHNRHNTKLFYFFCEQKSDSSVFKKKTGLDESNEKFWLKIYFQLTSFFVSYYMMIFHCQEKESKITLEVHMFLKIFIFEVFAEISDFRGHFEG